MATKKRLKSKRVRTYEQPIRWLPIDSRFLTPIFSFGSVKGVARLFLEIEITLSVLIVLGTMILAVIKIFEMLSGSY